MCTWEPFVELSTVAEDQVSIDSNSCSQVAARLVQKVAHRMCALA